MFSRRLVRKIFVGRVAVGGDAPVSVQSMTNTDPLDAEATLAQICQLQEAGCDIVRVTFPEVAALPALKKIVAGSPIPVVADIHFDGSLAILALDNGAACVRINPGNIRNLDQVADIARCAIANHRPVRIGVNAGSLAPEVLKRYRHPCAEALVESAVHYCDFFEKQGCGDLKVSLKAADVRTTVEASRLFAARTDYPLHIGVTEAGTATTGIIKSAAALGALLLDGIGDTLRVSLTAPPVEEIRAGIRILEAIGQRQAKPEIVSCPTCGRTRIDLLPLVTAVEAEIDRLKAEGYEIGMNRIALMGCVVNGPGEAREADFGIAGGDGEGVIFRNGKVVAKIAEAELLPAVIAELRACAKKPI